MRPEFPDTSADAVDWLLTANGYSVAWSRDGDDHVAVATSPAGQRYQARGTDPHAVVCELAELCGVEVEDGVGLVFGDATSASTR